MKYLILPTTELFEEFQTYDHLFWFNDEQTEGLIKQLITGRDFETVKDEVVHTFEKSLESLDRNNCSLDSYLNDLMVIDLALTEIREAVDRLLGALYRRPLKLSEVPTKWVGRDLLVKINGDLRRFAQTSGLRHR